MEICVVGVGLLGGSFALGVRAVRPSVRLTGVDADPDHARAARELRIVDATLPLEEAVATADLIVLAIPVDAIVRQLPAVLDRMRPDAVVVDFGSTKAPICRAAAGHPRRGRFVAAHPIAGTEHSGPRAAFPSLLMQNVMILSEPERSDPDALELVESLCRELEMRIAYMEPEAHDLHLAYVSHLSHISSFALGLTVLEKEKDETNIFNMAGSGFSSTARLAKSSPQMWAPIFTQNSPNISAALERYIANLQRFKDRIDAHDEAATLELMTRANGIRPILERIERGEQEEEKEEKEEKG